MATSPTRYVLFGCSMVLALVGLTTVPAHADSATDPVIYAAGDIACAPGSARTTTACHQADTASLIPSSAAAVLPLGDAQYNCGELSAFNSVYDPTWGQFNSKAYPVVGDNDYSGSTCNSPGAAGYFTYFGDRASPLQSGCTSACKGYYSYDIGSWHVVALNSECTEAGVGGCAATDPMATWLQNDLAGNNSACTLAYMHRPYWANHGVTTRLKPIVQILYDAGVDGLLVGHSHTYTRFAPQDPSSNPDPNGLRQFTVGTGGKNHGSPNVGLPNIDAENVTTFGVMKLTLHPSSYDFAFVNDPTSGTFTDSETGIPCHGATPVQQPPVASTGAATGVSSSGATLNGTVNPQGADTTYHFEYGTTTNYGVNTPTPYPSAGAGNLPQDVPAAITGLSPSTTYHYRLVATNSAGTTPGTDQTFTTSTATGSTPGSVTAPKILSGPTTDKLISVIVKYGAPKTGGAPTGYRITVTDQSTGTATTVNVGSGVLRTKVSGLVNGNSYQAQITAFNGAGDGPTVTTTTAATAK